MVRPHVIVRDELQVWRVAQNILDKQLRTADRGWFFRRSGSVRRAKCLSF
jgi:hypothetical protein